MIQKGEPIKLNPISIHHFKYGSNPWEDYGTPMIRPLFPTLAYKDKLRQSQWIVAERHILPVKVVKVGNDQRPASQEDLDSVQDELAAIANDPNLTLVTHHAFDFDYVGASGKVLQLTNEYELIDQEILDGVMLNKALLNGEGPTYGNAQVGLLAMAQRLETFRREVARWVEECVFKPVAEWNGFVVEGERGQEEVIYPTIKFNDLQLRDDSQKLQIMATANQQGVISNTSLIEAFGLDVDQGAWAIAGARQGTYMTMLSDWEYRDVQSFDALDKLWETTFVNDPAEVIQRYQEQLTTQLDLPMNVLMPAESKFFKHHYRSNWHNRGVMVREIDVIRQQEGW